MVNRPTKAPATKRGVKKPPVAKPEPAKTKMDSSTWYGIITVIILCFIFYGNTLTLKYAFDDLMVVTENQFVKKGTAGLREILTTDFFTGYFGKDQNMVSGGRYRPLSLVTFALEYQFFGENPMTDHLVNVLLFTAACVLVFLLARKFMLMSRFRTKNTFWFLSVPLVISLLFAGHPIHTEAVANIKSRDEILALLFCLLTLWFSLKYLEKNGIPWLVAGGISFFLALLSKENAITFLLIQPVTIFLFTRHKVSKNLVAIALPALATAVFLLIRHAVVGSFSTPLANDLMNNPFVEMTRSQKYATILYTLGLYLKLLVFPHPLTCDYYPYHIPIINPADWRAILPLVLYAAMILWVILKLRKGNLVAWCFFYYLVTLSLVSNLFFPIGAFMNERFLFMPSLGFAVLLGAGTGWLADRIPASDRIRGLLTGALLLVILVLYGYKTIDRNKDWYDSYTLFTTDVNVSVNSAKGNEVAGEYIMQKAKLEKNKTVRDSMLRRSITYQQQAIRVYPRQMVALINLAAAYYEYNQDYDTILAVYKTILGYVPGSDQIHTFFNYMMSKYDNADHKIKLYRDLLHQEPDRFEENLNLGSLYLNGKQDPGSALPFLEKAAGMNPGDFDAQNLLGSAYGILHRWTESAEHFEIADRIKPGNPELRRNLAIVYTNMGRPDKAREVSRRGP